jgi:predicted XRE-type DNA-binding protein
VYVSP